MKGRVVERPHSFVSKTFWSAHHERDQRHNEQTSCESSWPRRVFHRLSSRLTKNESFPQIVIRVYQKLIAPGNVRRTLHFGNDGCIPTKLHGFDDAAREPASDDAFDHDRLIESDLSARVVNGQAAAHAGAGRRTIHFTLCENADVAAVRIRRGWGANENRPV